MRELLDSIEFVSRLPAPERARLERLVLDFLEQVVVEGQGGHVPSSEDRLRLAASCAILYVGRPEWRPFPPVLRVTLTPWRFDQHNQPARDDHSGVVGGISHPERRVELSHRDFVASFADQEDGYHLAIHEFTHLLDFQDSGTGTTDGVPFCLPKPHVAPWLTVLERAWRAAGGAGSPLSAYAGTKIGETFAVAAENFFERPKHFRARDQELYRMLAHIFAQDPAAL